MQQQTRAPLPARAWCSPWFTDLLSALDSLSLLGFTAADSQVRKALDWLTDMQQEDGLWRLCLLRAGGDRDLTTWVSLAICRVFKRLGVQNGR